jgi:hypothetical protein
MKKSMRLLEKKNSFGVQDSFGVQNSFGVQDPRNEKIMPYVEQECADSVESEEKKEIGLTLGLSRLKFEDSDDGSNLNASKSILL